ncbi:MAG: SUMF1/EgtB/PvdO family nonheme iron enzyme [Candidatus Hydrogenedentes bacterium]|nr:SUMF1/EgtB/PvdO family nonheme iron enzyme [Candidatus Hydrogenedentota bacterium]
MKIDSAPESGARVLVEGGYTGETPVTFTGLPPGRYNVLLQMDRYRDTEDAIRVTVGEPQAYVIEMEPLVGYLTVESRPEGAEVILNGSDRLGVTPIRRHPLGVGEHQFEVLLENYYSYKSDMLDVKADHQYGTNTTINLKPLEGRLIVTSTPTGATIWINGGKRPEVTPKDFTLPPGNYIVDVHAPGHIMTGDRVKLEPNQEVRVSLTMKPGNVPPGMVLVPGGPFIRGAANRAPDEAPLDTIDVPAFYIDKYEVTNAEFRDVFPLHEFPEGLENYPVTGVSWNMAVDFAKAVGKRLPTELEWEKAARGPDGLEFPWGNEFDPTLCNMIGTGLNAPAERGRFIEGMSPYGVVDMAGNVYEWTQDWYQAYPGNRFVTKDYGQIFRVLRGGSFRSERFDVRTAKRHFDRVSATREDYGFRCAISAPESSAR